MPRQNTFASYGSIAKSFHWLTALLIFTAFPVGYFANELAQEIQSPAFDGSQAVIERATLLFSLHKTLGVTVFFTALLRILWALAQPKPGLLHPGRKAEAFAAETVHWLLYGSLVAVPLAGWTHHAATTGFAPIWWPFGQDLPFVPKSEAVAFAAAGLHRILVWTLAAALALHIAGALKHHVLDRDATLRRMLPGAARAPQPPAQSHSALPAAAAAAVWAAVIAGGASLGAFASPDRMAVALDSAPAAARPQVPSGWTVDSGTLGITVTQMGSAVTGRFGEWAASITFEEPAAPGPAGEAEVVISIPSLTLGSVTGQAMGPDYFDSAAFPTAVFKAAIEKLEEGYEARGTLTVRDQTVPVILPFTLALDGDHATMSGSATVNRRNFNIGQGVNDAATLGYEVEISVDLEATRAK